MHLLAHLSYICSNHFLSNHLVGKGRKKSPFADQHLDGCQRCPDFQKAVQKVTEPLLLQSELHRNEGAALHTISKHHQLVIRGPDRINLP